MDHNPASATAGQAEDAKPVVIGIYGISGCGKTRLIKDLKTAFSTQDQDW